MKYHRLLALMLAGVASHPQPASAQPPADLGLYRAIRFNRPDAVEAYLAQGGDPNAIIPGSPMGDRQLLRIAYAGRRDAIFVDLLRAGARSDIAGLDLYNLGYAGMDKALGYALSESAPPEFSEIRSALDVAISVGHYDAVAVILEYIDKSSLSAQELLRGTLASASAHGGDDIARLLIEHGAPIDNAALRAAARVSSPGMMRYLLQLGANPSELYDRPSRPEHGYLAIDFAWDTYLTSPILSQRQAAAFKIFDLWDRGVRSARADFAVAADGDELLARIASESERLVSAAEWGFYDTVSEILSGPIPLDPTVLTDATTAALRSGWQDVARLLLEAGSPPGGGPLHAAVRARNPGIVRLLLKLGADPNEIVDGYAPVDYWLRDDPAVLPDHSIMRSENLRELIAGGADVCRLVEQHLDEIRQSATSDAALWHSAPECWPEQQ